MRAVDTNVLVRILTRDDQKQARAADAFVERGAWISHIVLIETLWVLRSAHGFGPGEIANTLDMLLRHEVLMVQEPDVISAALDRFRHIPAVGFTDHLVVEVARRAGHLPVGTFDRGLARLDGAQRL